MKTTIIKQASALLLGTMLSLNAFSQDHVTMSMKNIKATTNTIEYDLYIVNDGTTTLKLSACSYGVNFNPDILNGGTLTYSYHENSRGNELKGLKPCTLSAEKRLSINQIRMTTTPVPFENAPQLVQNKPYKIGHFRISNSVAWKQNSRPDLSMQEHNQPGYTNTQLVAYSGNDQKLLGMTPSLMSVSTEVESSPVLNPSNGLELGAVNTSISDNPEESQVIPNSIAGLNHQMNIYPNPTNDRIHLDLNSDVESNLMIMISDLQGRTVKQIHTRCVEGMNKIELDIHELESAVYMVQVRNNQAVILVQKITKN